MSKDLMNLEALENKKDLIKRTLCKGATDDELELFIHICKRTGLDPIAKQIYAIKRGGTMTYQTGIDGYRLIAERTKKYMPGKETSYSYKNERLISATCYIKKLGPDGLWHEIGATAFYDEYCVDNNPLWKTKPHAMLSKCAESLVLRKAFPADMSGTYTEEEIPVEEHKIEREIDISPGISNLDTIKAECEEIDPTGDLTETYLNTIRGQTPIEEYAGKCLTDVEKFKSYFIKHLDNKRAKQEVVA